MSNRHLHFSYPLMLVLICAEGLAVGQTHPSGISQRVLIAVQNPTGAVSGNNTVVPQFSLQIANAATNAFPKAEPPLISGWSTSVPSSLENLPVQAEGLVVNEDGSASLLNYATESVITANIGISVPNTGSVLTQTLSYVMIANQQAGQVTIVNRQAGNATVSLSLPGVRNISLNSSATIAMVFAQDSSIAYYLRHLSSADSAAYANGAWPANAQDCEPYAAPTFCLLQVTSTGTAAGTYAAANFDHPVKAVDCAVEGNMYVLNGGPEADGTAASVTVVPEAPLFLEDGSQSGSIPTSPTKYSLSSESGAPGGADDAIAVGTTLYVTGQGRISPGLWAGELTTINLATGVVSNPMPMADGIPVRMTVADDNTLWIGSIRCNTGNNVASGAAYGCLTVVNLLTGAVTYVEPWLCPVDSNTVCATGDTPENYIYEGGGSGDVTGIAPIIGLHKVFYVEHGQVHIRSTVYTSASDPYPIISNSGVTVAGIATDIVYMDATSDSDGTSIGTTH